MKTLPDITDEAAMIDRGRHSVLMSARNDACEELRNVFVAVQSAPMAHLSLHADNLIAIADRLKKVDALWCSL